MTLNTEERQVQVPVDVDSRRESPSTRPPVEGRLGSNEAENSPRTEDQVVPQQVSRRTADVPIEQLLQGMNQADAVIV